MEVKFKFKRDTDRDVLCPFVILFKENKWYKTWNYLLTETIGGSITKYRCTDIKRCEEVLNEVGNPFEHNKRIIEKVSSKKFNPVRNY